MGGRARRRSGQGAALLALAFLAVAGVAGAAGFAPKADTQIGPPTAGSFGIATTDVNGDNVTDVLVTNNGSNQVALAIGKGDGTFKNISFYGGTGPYGIAAADVNGDGSKDVAVTNGAASTVSVMRGNGDGSFASPTSYAVGTTPIFVAVALLNGDANPDLAVANHDAATVSVLYGNGDGTFQPKVDYAVGTGPTSIAVGSFNGDGIQDLAVTNDGSATVSILMGKPDYTYLAKVDYATGAGPTSVVTARFAGTGYLDLAVTNFFSGSVSILLGNGNGTFKPKVDYPVGGLPGSLAAGQLDGDGRPDLAVSSVAGDNISVLLASTAGDGTFQAKVDYPAGDGARGVAIASMNTDRYWDIVVANQGAGTVSVILGDYEAPVTTVAATPAAPNGTNGWYTSAVGLTVTGTDFSSMGVSQTRCALDPATAPASFAALPAANCAASSIGADGTHTFYAGSIDKAGNADIGSAFSVKIDATAPQVTCGPTPSFTAGGSNAANVTATVTDAGSGPVDAAPTVDVTAADVASAGAKTKPVVGTDKAGNKTTISCPYTVTAAGGGGGAAGGGGASAAGGGGAKTPLPCRALRVVSVSTVAGRPQVRVKVTKGGKPSAYRVSVTGAGIATSVTTKPDGLATIRLKPTKSGTVTLSIRVGAACTTKKTAKVQVVKT